MTAGCTLRVPDRLILMRHAKSDYPAGVPDHDRPLNARGRRDAAAAGLWLAQHRRQLVRGSLKVLVSSAARAQQTWAIAGDGFSSAFATEPTIYEASTSTLFDLAARCSTQTVLIVGHNPTIESCVTHLIDERSQESAGPVKTCTIAALDLASDAPWSSGSAVVVAFETPRAD